MNYPNVERKHVLLGAGAFEERTYIDGQLVDTVVYHLQGQRVGNGAVRRAVPHRPNRKRVAA